MLRDHMQTVNNLEMCDDTFEGPEYQLSDQVGFKLRRANQRHVAIFARYVTGVTPTQFAALARLYEFGAISQNKLGRLTAMDSATIKGVVERLRTKEFVTSRRVLGTQVFEQAQVQAQAARLKTLERLTAQEVRVFEALLAKLV
jgi:DNA-binding MarR family transcriptional regulator